MFIFVGNSDILSVGDKIDRSNGSEVFIFIAI